MVENKIALVFIVDTRKNGNLMCLRSVLSFRQLYDNDIIVLTTIDNPFIHRYRKINIDPICVDYAYDDILNKTINFKYEGWFGYNRKRIGHYTYLRFLLFDYAFLNKYEKIIYIDIDTLAINKIDLTDVFNKMQIAQKPIGVVYEYNGSWLRLEQQTKIRKMPTQITHYFNAGIIFIDKKYFYQKNIYQILINLIPYEFDLTDQDILNLVFQNKAYELPIEYNMNLIINPHKKLDYTKGFIRHFCGAPEKNLMLNEIQQFLNCNLQYKDLFI